MVITPVLLCGGSGTRLWPLSRKSYPKQFSPLLGRESLFQASARRLSGPGFAAPVVVTTDDFRFIVTEQLAEIGLTPAAILIEPEGRDTAPAILAAALYLAGQDPDGMMLVAPSDHAIPDVGQFAATVRAGLAAAGAGRIVTFGIRPDRAETGYGYLELDGAPDWNTPAPVPLRAFVEKPDATRAAAMLSEGRYLWNAGIFLTALPTLLQAYRAADPAMVSAVTDALAAARQDLGFTRLDRAAWDGATAVSVDYAVMERATNLAVVPFAGRWSDLGDWAAVWRETETQGLAIHGPATAIDCQDSLLRSEVAGQEIVGIGLDGIIAVARCGNDERMARTPVTWDELAPSGERSHERVVEQSHRPAIGDRI